MLKAEPDIALKLLEVMAGRARDLMTQPSL
jgi:hypothetical protein